MKIMKKILRKCRNKIRRFGDAVFRKMFCRVGLQKMWEAVFRLSLKGMNIGGGSFFYESGEASAIKHVLNIEKDNQCVVFDVGANVGEYTKNILQIIKQKVEIHCFEPSKGTYKKLCKNISDKRCVLNQIGLGDEEGILTLYSDSCESGLASLYNRQLDYMGINFKASEEVSVNTLDHYCEEKEISHIHYLKIDVEGFELNVLRGAANMLRRHAIDAIQIEFGGTNIDARTYMRDFWNLLNTEFNMYRIIRNGVWQIYEYSELLECFTCTNYLFVKKEHDQKKDNYHAFNHAV